MKFIPYKWILLICILFQFACSPTDTNQETILEETTESTTPKEYQLVWADEFDVDGAPNPDNWSFEEGFVRNHELQWYQPDNAFVENGVLVIEGRRDTFPNPTYVGPEGDWRTKREKAFFTSSSLKTEGKHNWRYGRFEIKAKIIAEEGLWPAIWTLGEGHEWPQGGEIDIMEYYDGNILANAAWAGEKQWQAVWDDFRKPVSELGENWDADFHIWRMDWDEFNIKLYVDDQLLNNIPLNNVLNKRGPIQNPFRETQHYILLNLAIGGRSGGSVADTRFPSRYEIDYVRVYQLQ